MNNEIEVGDFVRLKQGYIGTVENINDFREPSMKYAVDIQKRDLVFVGDDDIVKHSKNKIDLVECSDYVNGSKVLEIMEDMNTGEIHLEMTSNYTNQEIGDCTIYDKDIKTIVTKEVFKEREYVFLGGNMEVTRKLEWSDFNTYPHYVYATAFLVNGELADYIIQNTEKYWGDRTFRGSKWENEVWEKGFITKEIDLSCAYNKILVNNDDEHNKAFEDLEDWLFNTFKIYEKSGITRWSLCNQ